MKVADAYVQVGRWARSSAVLFVLCVHAAFMTERGGYIYIYI